MFTFVLLMVTTLVGGAIGHIGFAHMWLGAMAGLLIGLALRFGLADELADAFD